MKVVIANLWRLQDIHPERYNASNILSTREKTYGKTDKHVTPVHDFKSRTCISQMDDTLYSNSVNDSFQFKLKISKIRKICKICWKKSAV